MNEIFVDATTAAQDAYAEQFNLLTAQEQFVVSEWLTELRAGMRTYFLGPYTVEEHLWPRVRNDETLLNFVMRASIGFHLRLGSKAYDAFVTDYAQAVAGLTHHSRVTRTAKEVVTDQAFNEHLPLKVDLEKLLAREQWLGFVVAVEQVASSLSPTETPPSAGKRHENTAA